MNCLKLLLDLTDRLKLSRVALSSVVFVKGKCYYFFAPCCVNVNIWCLGLLWLDMHSHSQLQTLCPSCRPLLDRTCDSSWAPNLLQATAAIFLQLPSSTLAPCLQQCCNESQAKKRSPKESDKSTRLNTDFQLQPPHPTHQILPILPQLENGSRPRQGRRKEHQEEDYKGFSSFFDCFPVSTFYILFFIFSCHFGLSSQIESCFPNWPEKSFCHVEVISRAKSGNLRQRALIQLAGMWLAIKGSVNKVHWS